MVKSMDEIAQLLLHTKFKRRLFGIDEADVWEKLKKLHKEYAALLDLERAQHKQQVSDLQAYAATLEEEIRRKDGPRDERAE